MSLVITRDALCYICGKIDDHQEEYLPGTLGTPPLTAHRSCAERRPDLMALRIEETKAKDKVRDDEYMKASNAFWEEMEARRK